MKIDDFSVWEAFLGVALHGNFSKAAIKMNLTVPQVSKRVAQLEDELGVRLFHRSTRVVNLTDEGKILLPKAQSLLEEWSGLENYFESKKLAPSGVIRITCLPFLGQWFLMPVLIEFRKKYPMVQFDIELSEKIINLAEDQIDLALRIHNNPPDSSLIYRKLAPNTLVVCASPRYLKKKSIPKKPQDLFDHEILALPLHHMCRFGKTNFRVKDFVENSSVFCENGWFLTQLALNDFGVLVRSIWDVHEFINQEKLIPILKQDPLGDFGSIFAITPSKKLVPHRVRLFLDFLFEHVTAHQKNLPDIQKTP